MTTGHPPFAGDSAVAIAYKHVQENPMPPPRRIDPALPETLEAITLKCLAKNPANRYPGAQDLRADLRRYLDGSRIMAEPVLAPPIDPGATGMMANTGYGDQTALVAGPVGLRHGRPVRRLRRLRRLRRGREPKRSKWFLVALVLLLLVLAGLLFLLARSFGNEDPEVDAGDGAGRRRAGGRPPPPRHSRPRASRWPPSSSTTRRRPTRSSRRTPRRPQRPTRGRR